jgi:hypothetical protein
MKKLRIKLGHDCFEGNYYTVQKRTCLFFWSDISSWFKDFDNAKKELDKISLRIKSGVVV